jgi:putative FmdB family regulatory protein
MPTYEYRCKSCGHEFEEFQPMSADPLMMCPKCAQPALKRLMSSGAGLIFKGSGFYLTDYKKSNTSNSSGSSTESQPKSKSPKESKQESKSDSHQEAKTDSQHGSKPPSGTNSGKDDK